MSALRAVALREFASFFRLPLGWIVIALFLFLSGIVFSQKSLVPGAPASMRDFFVTWFGLLFVIAPAISMRLLSEEIRAGTLEPIMSSPAGEVSVALGKFAGALLFLLACLGPTLVFPGILALLSRPDPGPIAAGYLGMVLVGMAYLAVGLLFSALTSSQTLAFLGTLFTLLLVEIGAQQAAALVPERFVPLVNALSVNLRIADFARGVIDTGHIVFFLAITVWCVALTALSLRARRWR